MYNWKERREKKCFLALATGEVFRGWGFGARKDVPGEVVFNTGMTGYQEILTDPSYAGQLVTLTTPEVGNYGWNGEDGESRGLFLNGLLIYDLNEPSNYRSDESLEEAMKRTGIPGLAGVDTRALTLLLREGGSRRGYLHVSEEELTEEEGVRRANCWPGLDGIDYASRVTGGRKFVWSKEGEIHIAVVDYGVKFNILRELAEAGARVTVLPASATAGEVLRLKPDGVFLSTGPGDPAGVRAAWERIRGVMGKLPVMGICLGHQLLGLALGGECGRLKFGHHGCNHPVRNLLTGQVEITSQNHNFALREETLPGDLEVTHRNLNDGTVEGVRHRREPLLGIQYHPESAPGPHDSKYLFNTFRELVEEA